MEVYRLQEDILMLYNIRVMDLLTKKEIFLPDKFQAVVECRLEALGTNNR